MTVVESTFLREWRALPFGGAGTCVWCRRSRDDDREPYETPRGHVHPPLIVRGRVSGALVCLRCFDERGKAPGRRVRLVNHDDGKH